MQLREVPDVVGCLLTGQPLPVRPCVGGVQGADELAVGRRAGGGLRDIPSDSWSRWKRRYVVTQVTSSGVSCGSTPTDSFLIARGMKCESWATASSGWLSSMRCSRVVPDRGQPTTKTNGFWRSGVSAQGSTSATRVILVSPDRFGLATAWTVAPHPSARRPLALQGVAVDRCLAHTSCHRLQRGVLAAGTEQFELSALFRDPLVLEVQDLVGAGHLAQVVGDQERGATPREVCQRIGHQPRVLAVKAGGWLVQDQDGRIADGRTGDRDALSLSTGQSYATFAQHGVVTVGQRLYELVGVGQSCRGLDLLRRRVGRAVPDVLPHGGSEQKRVLEDHADLGPEGLQGVIADVASVHKDAPGLRVIQAQDEVDQRGLAMTRCADNRDPLPSLDLEGDFAQDRVSRFVGERHGLEADISRSGGAETASGLSSMSGSCWNTSSTRSPAATPFAIRPVYLAKSRTGLRAFLR